MLEICVISVVFILAAVAVALMVLVWKFRPVPDNEAIHLAAQRLQVTFEDGIQWERQRQADIATGRVSLAQDRGLDLHDRYGDGHPVAPEASPEQEKFPGEESVELEMQC